MRVGKTFMARGVNTGRPAPPRTFYGGRILWPAPHIRWPTGPWVGPHSLEIFFLLKTILTILKQTWT